eukprot:112626-Amphidinium_carterae.2
MEIKTHYRYFAMPLKAKRTQKHPYLEAPTLTRNIATTESLPDIDAPTIQSNLGGLHPLQLAPCPSAQQTPKATSQQHP